LRKFGIGVGGLLAVSLLFCKECIELEKLIAT